MKKVISVVIILFVFILSCSKKNDVIQLEKGTESYQLALELTKKIPYLDPEANNLLAQTNNFKISTGEVVDVLLKNLGKRISQVKSMDQKNLRIVILNNAKNLAEKKLLIKAAKEAGISISSAELDSSLSKRYVNFGGKEKFTKFLADNKINLDYVRGEIKAGLIIKKYLDQLFTKRASVSEEELKAEYEQEKTATVRHILLKTTGKSVTEKQEIRKKLEKILARARRGENFTKLAKQYSEDEGSKKNGGLYEDFSKGAMVKPFEEAAFSVPVGKISDIVETRYGYHIIKVINRKKEQKPFEAVKESLQKKLIESKKENTYKQLMEKLKKDSNFHLTEF